MSVMDREKLSPHQRARLIEEENARKATGELWKAGKANDPSVVKVPQELPQKYYAIFEQEMVMRLHNAVPYEETRQWALEIALKHWRKDKARKANKANQSTLF